MIKLNNNGLVVKSNQIVEAKYKLNMIEQKIILFLVSLIKKDDEVFKVWKIKVSELSDFLGISSKYAYKELKKSTYNMLKRTLSLKSTDRELQLNWLASADYFNKEGYVELEISEKLKPFLLQLKDNFTKYSIKQIISLKSTYSIRMYELLKQYENIGERLFDIEELKNILGISGKYNFYGNFKIRILESSRVELLQKTDIKFTWEVVKAGRKITGIHFFIKKNKAQKKDGISIKKNNTKIELNQIQELINLVPEKYRDKETVKDTLEKYLKLKGFDFVKGYIEYSNIKANKNYGVYLKRALKEKWDVSDIEDIKKDEQKKQKEYKKEIAIQNEYEARRLLKIKIVDNLKPKIERELRDYVYVQKNKKPVKHDKQNKRLKYKKGALVIYLMAYLKSVVQEYKSNNSVSVDEVRKWFEKYTGIKDIDVFNSIIQDRAINKYF